MDMAFKLGKPYPEVRKPLGYVPVSVTSVYLIDEYGVLNEVMPWYLKEYFQELPPLNEEDVEDEDNRQWSEGAAEFSKGFPRGCAIACATLLTVVVVIYLIVKWNS
jgi:hypothetical protein